MKKYLCAIACLFALSASAQIAEVGKPELVRGPHHSAAIQQSAKSSVDVRTEGSQLIISRNGVEKSYTPVESVSGYIWASVSPDNTKIVFFSGAKGLIVTDLEGNILSRPGKYEAPSWFGNNHLVVQNATDDGHQLHSSQILLITLDGKQTQRLTAPESMTMEPEGDAESCTVWFSTIDGLNYRQSVKLK